MMLSLVARTAALTLLTIGLALPALADGWNQKRASELASELEQTLGLALEAAQVAHPQRTAMQQRTRDAAVLEMKRAHEFSREYASKLRSGWGRSDTEPIFDTLRRMTQDARETARNAVPDPAVAPHLERLDVLLLELSKQYEAD